MSRIYDNWGKLVAEVVKKEQLWQLFHEQSRSPSLSSESSSFSFNLGSIDDFDFSGSIFEKFASDSIQESPVKQISVAGSSSSVLVKDQLPDAASTELPVPPLKNNTRSLVVEVPKLQIQSWDAFDHCCQATSKHSWSPSPSLSSESSSFSFNLGSIDDFDFSGSIFEKFASDSIQESPAKQISVAGSSSSVLVKDQLPDVVSTELPVPPLKNNSSNRSRRRSLVVEVPKLQIQSWDAFDHCCRATSNHSWSPSPGTVSPVGPLPTSRIPSVAATPIHQGAGGGRHDSRNNWPNDTKQKCHPLPLPPITVSPTSPSLPRNPGRAKNPVSPGSPWKKGKLIHRDTNGCVYIGFNSETGEMCAMKEVVLSSDDAESKKSAKQLKQEIAMLSSLRHPNIVQYYGSEVLDEKFYIYSEYISGGTVSKILKEYGRLGESAIRSYTKQILSGLAYLHSKSTVHRDIRGASILVNPNGGVKLAGFGTANHITIEPFDGLAFKGLPYWTAPEIIRNSRESGLAVDIWSVGCTVLEMATARPPWSQYGGAVAMFKIGCTSELPTTPDYLSEEGKGFVRLCLQRNPLNRPTAAQLLKHHFVKSSSSHIEKQKLGSTSSYHLAASPMTSLGINHARNLQHLDSERLAYIPPDGIYTPRNISRAVSPVEVASPRPPSSPQHGVSPVAVQVPIPHPLNSPERLHWYEI